MNIGIAHRYDKYIWLIKAQGEAEVGGGGSYSIIFILKCCTGIDKVILVSNL